MMKRLLLSSLMSFMAFNQLQAHDKLILSKNDLCDGITWGLGVPLAAGLIAGSISQYIKVKDKPNPTQAFLAGAPQHRRSADHYDIAPYNDHIGYNVSRWTNLFTRIGAIFSLYYCTYIPNLFSENARKQIPGSFLAGLFGALAGTYLITETIEESADPAACKQNYFTRLAMLLQSHLY